MVNFPVDESNSQQQSVGLTFPQSQVGAAKLGDILKERRKAMVGIVILSGVQTKRRILNIVILGDCVAINRGFLLDSAEMPDLGRA